MSNLTNNARQKWQVVKNETNKYANTPSRVGAAGISIIETVEDVDSRKLDEWVSKNGVKYTTLTSGINVQL